MPSWRDRETTRNGVRQPGISTDWGTPGLRRALAMAFRNGSLDPGPTQSGGSFLAPVCRKNTELRRSPRRCRSSGTSWVASSATSSTRRSYKLSRGVSLETCASTSASPLNQASLRSRMMLATSMYMTPKARAVPTAKARVAHSDMRQAAVWRRGLRIFENITDSTNGVDQGAHGIAIHLGTQAVDVNIHHVGSGINAHAPHVIENHGTGDHAADVAAQIFQEREFLWGELQEMIAATGFTADQVEFKVGDAQFNRFFLSRAGAAQEVAQAGHEFSESKGLGEVIVAAMLEATHP